MIKKIDFPELIIALVGAAGTNLDLICTVIKQELSKLEYNSEKIVLSSILTQYSKECEPIDGIKDKYDCYEDRLRSLMDAGDNFCDLKNQKGAMAALAITNIWEIRKNIWGKIENKDNLNSNVTPENVPLESFAYIIKSVKRPEEIEILKNVYGKKLIVISVFADKAQRIKNLSENICKSLKDSSPKKYEEKAIKLIERDMNSSLSFGQDVEEAFPLADYFIEEMDQVKLSTEVGRFFKIFFNHPFIEPTKEEFGIFIASAAAKKSLDLSRQVGASILDESGRVISVGCNDVPAFGGGCSWHPEKLDFRDYQNGSDYNATHRIEILKEMFEALKSEGWISDKLEGKSELDLANESINKKTGIINDCRINNLLEFGRIVHAEMDAISEAARNGASTKGGILFCTTFPCHICSRHIIAAGIKTVYFIEPYPKSLTYEMYKDIVSLDVNSDDDNKVKFLPFMGVSPKNFMRFFKRGKRKDSQGYALDWINIPKKPNISIFLQDHVELEKYVVDACFGGGSPKN